MRMPLGDMSCRAGQTVRPAHRSGAGLFGKLSSYSLKVNRYASSAGNSVEDSSLLQEGQNSLILFILNEYVIQFGQKSS